MTVSWHSVVFLVFVFICVTKAWVPPAYNVKSLQKIKVPPLRISLKETYDELRTSISNKFDLQTTDFTETYECQTWSKGDTKGTADWLQEASPQFLTGASFYTKSNSQFSSEEYTINIWMGPSYDVPNMLLTFGEVAPNNYFVTSDFVVRGSVPFGSDPQYVEKYYSSSVTQAWKSAYSNPDVVPMHSELSTLESRILFSPARISVSNLNQEVSIDMINTHVSTFLSFLDTAQPIAARLRGSFNLRDDKLRQFYFSGELVKNQHEFGEDLGRNIAASNTGPLAEAYVGGGS